MLSGGPERKEGFQDDKNINVLKSKKWVFSKGVNLWFWSKNRNFLAFVFFSKIRLETMLSDPLDIVPFKGMLTVRCESRFSSRLDSRFSIPARVCEEHYHK